MPNIDTVPLSSLRFAHDAPVGAGIHQARKTVNGDETVALGKSILAIGLIVPLVVKIHDGIPYVIAGNRRLAALRNIHGETAPVGVPVVDAEALGGTAAEVALADNVIRSPLHPVDKFEAFAALVESGLDADAIAKRFSITPRQVDQALAVGRLADVIRDDWRSGKLSGETATAFTIEPDQKRQIAVYKKLQKHGGNIGDWSVRRELLGDDAHDGGGGRLLKFVTPAAYEAAGGAIKRDFFRENGDAVSDKPLLKRLADEKLTRQAEHLVGDGWAFAVFGPDADQRYGWPRERVEPVYEKGDKARLKAIEKRQVEIGDILNGDDEIEGAADLDAEHNKLDDEHQAIEAAAEARAWPAEKRAKFGCVLDVANDGTIRVEVGYKRTARAEKAAAVAKPATEAEKKKAATDKAKAVAKGEVSNALTDRLKVSRRKAIKAAIGVFADVWGAKPVGAGAVAAAIARLVAAKIKPDERWNSAWSDEELLVIAAAIDAETMLGCLRKAFDSKDYFSSVPKAFALQAIKESGLADQPGVAKLKTTGDVAKFAIANVPATGWLPALLRTPHYAAPTSAGKKPKAGKPARRAKRKG